MRSAIVPAQMTTVEDKVMGNLSLSQLLLLSLPIFIGSFVYFVFPPSLGAALYKTILIVVATLVLWAMAIRFKGRILLLWVITIGRYNLRPRHFVNDKNDVYLREPVLPADSDLESENEDTEVEETVMPAPALSFAETIFLEKIIADPQANLHFKADRKGELRVHINEDK